MKNQIAIHVEHTWCYSLSEFWARAAFVNLFFTANMAVGKTALLIILLPIWQLVRLHY